MAQFDIISYIIGVLVMIFGVVLPLSFMIYKNKKVFSNIKTSKQ
ncbi:hypothetical protein DDB_G0289255 [Dictyostelium discoideum AX4]|uniref:Uncharacterized protein n=1 Tax=Dictyostelium discoideum TaxID=44689 RepID=Q54HS4_DICDI|nr:hypothetical protein DDB_G0289255 [Dictyostelium discoideum AX4]EAL62815.1 hypothetical protein DDB_G0289255 [Dictyostelium discoideum AX4]|eukprot:XP_636257.1 hypothetical protein DDB_G0289255 [Dictyostelium discoideum AX4]